jgi:predicted nuclease of predicted toxin-antitoxin system
VIIWVDAQLSPAVAGWINDSFGVEAHAVRDLGLRSAKDPEIFRAARHEGIVVMSKDSDFVDLVERLGPPPQILWVTCANTSNLWLKRVLATELPRALQLLGRGEQVVEITGRAESRS